MAGIYPSPLTIGNVLTFFFARACTQMRALHSGIA
jgi:hypothetical protein